MKRAFIKLNPREIFGPAWVNTFNVEIFLAKKGVHSCKILRILTIVAEFREGKAITMRSWPIPIFTFVELRNFRGILDQWNHYIILKGAQQGVYIRGLEQVNYFLLLDRSSWIDSVTFILVFGIGSLLLMLSLLYYNYLCQEFDLFF